MLDCHWEPSADIPFAHLDATVEWSGIGKSRHTLGIEVEDADDPDWLAGHGHDLFRQPAGTYSHHMDLGFSASGNYRGVAYLTSVAVGPDGSVWFGTTAEGSARFLPGS